ncbi:MAG: hypothetical protein IH789_01155 [Acidobacteria bacterium]|nr:hypothetical protein [Acidobacteriota bacterium]
MATLYQPPFVQPIRLPQNQKISYVRAVAHLVDGNSTEDLVFVNSPDFLEEIGEAERLGVICVDVTLAGRYDLAVMRNLLQGSTLFRHSA